MKKFIQANNVYKDFYIKIIKYRATPIKSLEK